MANQHPGMPRVKEGEGLGDDFAKQVVADVVEQLQADPRDIICVHVAQNAPRHHDGGDQHADPNHRVDCRSMAENFFSDMFCAIGKDVICDAFESQRHHGIGDARADTANQTEDKALFVFCEVGQELFVWNPHPAQQFAHWDFGFGIRFIAHEWKGWPHGGWQSGHL